MKFSWDWQFSELSWVIQQETQWIKDRAGKEGDGYFSPNLFYILGNWGPDAGSDTDRITGLKVIWSSSFTFLDEEIEAKRKYITFWVPIPGPASKSKTFSITPFRVSPSLKLRTVSEVIGKGSWVLQRQKSDTLTWTQITSLQMLYVLI